MEGIEDSRVFYLWFIGRRQLGPHLLCSRSAVDGGGDGDD